MVHSHCASWRCTRLDRERTYELFVRVPISFPSSTNDRTVGVQEIELPSSRRTLAVQPAVAL